MGRMMPICTLALVDVSCAKDLSARIRWKSLKETVKSRQCRLVNDFKRGLKFIGAVFINLVVKGFIC